MRVAYVGNFGPSHSTESHVAASLREMGHEVVPLQENDEATWAETPKADVVMWTRTWHLPEFDQLGWLRALDCPSVAFHLDRWWGLNREHQVHDEPMFRCGLVVTADGGHDAQWAEAGVNHRWLPPAVYRGEAERVGEYQRPFASDVAFVGSWRSYHAEWTHRMELVTHLRRWYGGYFKVWPRGPRAVRGQMLADLYASVRVLVGDSCLAGGIERYWSDRIPETLGRGGLLVHPTVVGLDEHFTPGRHLRTWELGDWRGLREQVDAALEDRAGSREIAEAGRAHVLENHLYEHRMVRVLEWASELA